MAKRRSFAYETVHMTVYAGAKRNGTKWCKVVLWVAPLVNGITAKSMAVPFALWLRNPAAIADLLDFVRMYGVSIKNEEGSSEAWSIPSDVMNDDSLDGVDAVKEYRHAYCDLGCVPCHKTVRFDSIRVKVDSDGKVLRAANGRSITASKCQLTYWDNCWRPDLCEDERYEELMKQWVIPTVEDEEGEEEDDND